ncbi:hypothetical protein [Vibrio sp. 10N.247.311.51]|uniref:hypothetical protein n=1 Tax=Vibrio sp. 10N.247.311.51 TaxID=3229996 RepID=UPI00354C1695
MKKEIFGKSVVINSSKKYEGLVLDSVDLYHDCKSEHTDIVINVGKKSLFNIESTNPKLLSNCDSGFITRYRNIEISWGYIDSILNVYVNLKEKSKLRDVVSKVISMEFATQSQMIGQILHELVLVPMNYFFGDCFPIHAATVCKNNRSYLFTGTGGVGKSSALLSLKDAGYSFHSDDIVLINKNGITFGNMAKPKIYGYNCAGNSIQKLILKDRNVLDQAHFLLKNKYNPSKVRRKICPKELFNGSISLSAEAQKMFYLFREDVNEFCVSEINDLVMARDMAISVISAEYIEFHRFIEWHNYNSIALGKKPLLTIEGVLNYWSLVLDSALKNIKIYKVSIPINMTHGEYQKSIKALIDEL